MMLREARFSRMRLLVVAFMLLLLPVPTPDAFAQASGTTANGRVKGLQGGPKQFVAVALEGPGRHVAITNAEGGFKIPNVTPGRYTVRVRQGDLVAVFTRDVDGSPIDLIVKW